VALFVELSPMTAPATPAVPFLISESCPSVSIVYDFIPTHYPRAYLRSAIATLENRIRVEALRHYDRLLCISGATADDCHRLLGPRVDARVTWVADPLATVAPVKPNVTHPFMLIPVGGDARKNPAAALAGLAQYREAARAPLRGVVTGHLTGGQEASLRELASQLGLPADAVDLRGNVGSAELAALYGAADLAFVGSFAEGFSIPVTEAVLRGTPVVASDIPPHRELIGAGPWLANPKDISSFAHGIDYVQRQRARVVERQRHALGDKAAPSSVRERVEGAVYDLLPRPRPTRSVPAARRARPRLAVVAPFPPQRSGVADYTAFTFREVAKTADVEIYSSASATSAPHLPVHRLSAEPYVTGRFDAVVNVVGNSHFHFPILDLMGSYGGACIAHDDRMVEAYRHDRGDQWTAELLSRPSHPVRAEELLDLLVDLDRLPSIGYDLIAQQASPLIVHGETVADTILHDTGSRPIVIPFVPYNLPSVSPIDENVVEDAGSSLGLATDIMHIGTFGIVDRRTKGIDLIIAAAAWLQAWGVAAQLHIVGESSWLERRALRRLAGELELDRELLFHGHVSRAQLEQFLLGVDVAVQLRTSSRLSLSGTLADCIAFGIPTVTSANSAAELEAPSYVVTTPPRTSSLLTAEAILSLRDRRRSDMAVIERERQAYLARRSPYGYARGLLSALGLEPA
jgi:glycosyltransferase involved in cell wall biosynthesis